MFRVIIAGGRLFDDYTYLKESMDYLLQNINDEIIVVCGKARGAVLSESGMPRKEGTQSIIFRLIGIDMGKLLGTSEMRKWQRMPMRLLPFGMEKVVERRA